MKTFFLNRAKGFVNSGLVDGGRIVCFSDRLAKKGFSVKILLPFQFMLSRLKYESVSPYLTNKARKTENTETCLHNTDMGFVSKDCLSEQINPNNLYFLTF